MPAFDPPVMAFFPRVSFNGIEFPVSNISVRGGLRRYIHEFPHSPGGEPEKMGRKLYVIRMRAFFHNLEGSEFGDKYPNLYPGTLNILRQLFESETTCPLVLPSIGTIQAYASDWEQIADFKDSLSGEEVNLEFEEDQASAFLTNSIFSFGANLADHSQTLMGLVENLPVGAHPNIFDAINDAVTAVQAAMDAGDAFDNLIAGKLEYLAQLCETADRDVTAFQDPNNHLALDALKDLWTAANDLVADVAQTGATIQTFTVPQVMAVNQVAVAIYGDSSRSVELMDLNPLDDALAIPAGTVIRYRTP